MVARILCAAICGLILAAGLGASTATAIEIHCIEASKYKYLWQLFGGDGRKLASFLQIGAARLPHPDMCRAALVVGGIDAANKSREGGQASDVNRLLDAIEQNQGWLSTLYLASRGGNIGMGLQLGEVARLFWLKTRAPAAKQFAYEPDFVHLAVPVASQPGQPPMAVPAADLVQGWAAYQQASANAVQVQVPEGSGRCASACTFIHVAGIDRQGTIYVHRGRRGKRDDPKRRLDTSVSMADTLEGMHRAEARVIAYYRAMDSGEDVVRLFQRTPSATTVPTTTDRTPRYIADVLRAKCGADPGRLGSSERKLRENIAVAESEAAKAGEAARLRNELTFLAARRGGVERCSAAAHESERLTQYAKYCGGKCDRRAIAAAVIAKLRAREPQLPPAVGRRE